MNIRINTAQLPSHEDLVAAAAAATPHVVLDAQQRQRQKPIKTDFHSEVKGVSKCALLFSQFIFPCIFSLRPQCTCIQRDETWKLKITSRGGSSATLCVCVCVCVPWHNAMANTRLARIDCTSRQRHGARSANRECIDNCPRCRQ